MGLTISIKIMGSRSSLVAWKLRIQLYHCCGTGLISGQATSACCGHVQKKKRKERLWDPGLKRPTESITRGRIGSLIIISRDGIKMVEQKDWSSPSLIKTKLQPNAEPLSTKWSGNFQNRYQTPEDKEEATSRW